MEELAVGISSNTWIWAVPADLIPGVDYRIYIENVKSGVGPGGYALDYSDGYFSIVEAP